MKRAANFRWRDTMQPSACSIRQRRRRQPRRRRSCSSDTNARKKRVRYQGRRRCYINHRNERATEGMGFSNRNKVEDSQARRLGEYGYHFSSASTAESTRNGVGQFMSAWFWSPLTPSIPHPPPLLLLRALKISACHAWGLRTPFLVPIFFPYFSFSRIPFHVLSPPLISSCHLVRLLSVPTLKRYEWPSASHTWKRKTFSLYVPARPSTFLSGPLSIVCLFVRGRAFSHCPVTSFALLYFVLCLLLHCLSSSRYLRGRCHVHLSRLRKANIKS